MIRKTPKLRKLRTPLQDWASQRWMFKGALTAAKALIYYHMYNTPLAQTEDNGLNRILKEIHKILVGFPRSQRITRERIRRFHAKTRA